MNMQNSFGGITLCKGKKNEHKGTETGVNEANHLSTGACMHIKQRQKKNPTLLQRLPHKHGIRPA